MFHFHIFSSLTANRFVGNLTTKVSNRMLPTCYLHVTYIMLPTWLKKFYFFTHPPQTQQSDGTDYKQQGRQIFRPHMHILRQGKGDFFQLSNTVCTHIGFHILNKDMHKNKHFQHSCTFNVVNFSSVMQQNQLKSFWAQSPSSNDNFCTPEFHTIQQRV